MFLFPSAYLFQQDDKQPQRDCWNQKKIFLNYLIQFNFNLTCK